MAQQKKNYRGKPGVKKTPEQMAEKILGGQGYCRMNNNVAKLEQLPPEKVVANCNHALQLAYLPGIDATDAMQVRGRVQEFFTICAQNSKKPTVSALALALGVDRRTLWTWMSGYTPRPAAVVVELKRAYSIINAEMEDYMLEGTVNPVAGIFLMKNNHGYTDRTELEVKREDPLGEGQTREDLDQKYAATVVDAIDLEPAE